MSSAQGEDAEEEGLPGLRHVEMMELWGRSLRQQLPKVLEPLSLWACISPRALSSHCPEVGQLTVPKMLPSDVCQFVLVVHELPVGRPGKEA